MNRNTCSTILAGVAALAVAAAPAAAKPGEKPAKPDKPGKGKGISYVFKGTYAGEGAVSVTKGNNHADDFEGQTVVFDFSAAKFSVADTNGDGAKDLADFTVGDSVVVKAKLPRGAEPTQPIAAKQLVHQDGTIGEEEPAV
jgi:hypothetical protein